MKITEEMIARVKEIGMDFDREYEYIGIRVQEVPFELGKMDHVSHIWDDGNDTGEEIDGVCVINFDQAELAKNYFGDHIAIIGGNNREWGEDAGEIIISDPVVLEVLA